MSDDVDKIPKFNPMPIRESPLVEDVYGAAGEFLEELDVQIKGEPVYNVLGIQPAKTFLLAGEKGTGKTMSINAYNNSKNQHVLNMTREEGFDGKIDISEFNLLTFSYDIGKYGTAYINMSSRIVQQFFDTVGMYAQVGKKCLVMLDEADALLSSRKSTIQTHSEDRKTLETIMKNLQTAHDTPNMYVALVTNLPKGCDDAALRAGRIDEKYLFKLPNELERKTAFEKKFESAREKAGYNLIRKVNTDNLVEMTEGFNYADIVTSVDKAIRDRATELVKDKCMHILGAPYISGKRLEDCINDHKEKFVETRKSRRIGFK